jgi:hypothetical protein
MLHPNLRTNSQLMQDLTWRFFSWTRGALGSGDASFVYLRAGTGMANHFFQRKKKGFGNKAWKGTRTTCSRQQAGSREGARRDTLPRKTVVFRASGTRHTDQWAAFGVFGWRNGSDSFLFRSARSCLVWKIEWVNPSSSGLKLSCIPIPLFPTLSFWFL